MEVSFFSGEIFSETVSFLKYLKINKYKYLHSVSSLYPVLERGFDRVKTTDGYFQNKYEFLDSAGIARGSHTNFDRHLRNIFDNSVNDTSIYGTYY